MQACWHVDVNHKSQSRYTPSLVFQLTPRAAELGRYGFSSITRTGRLMEYGKRPRNRRHTNVRNTPLPPPENSVQPSHHQPPLYITFTQAITRIIAQIVWLGGGGGLACATHATKRSLSFAVASQKLQQQTYFLPREIKSSEQVHAGNTKRWHARAEAAHNFPSRHQATWLPVACTHSVFFPGPTVRLRRPKIAYTLFVARRSPILSSSPEDRLHSPQPCCWSFSDLPRPRPRHPSPSQ